MCRAFLSDLPHPFDCGRHVGKAASAPRVSDLACAPAGSDVRPDAGDRERFARSLNFFSDVAFVLTEAVADGSASNGLFLPDCRAHIPLRERRPPLGEVHHVTACTRAEAIIA